MTAQQLQVVLVFVGASFNGWCDAARAHTDAHAPVLAQVAVSTKVAVNVVAPGFVGVNCDWWLDKCGGEGPQWSSNASIALLNLSNARLKALAKGLEGATWRIGGTHQDSVIYQVGNSTEAQECANHKHTHCYPICLTMQRWESILQFAAEAGLRVAFGVNFRLDAPPDNVLALLNYTRAKKLHVDAFELGNELGIENVEKYGKVVADAVARLWSGADMPKPMVVGPDDPGDGSNAPNETELLKLVGEQDFLDVIDFHAYTFHNGGGPTPSLVQHMMNTTLLDQGMQIYADVLDAVRSKSRPSYQPQVWMGEGNAAGHGGRLTVTNTFINSFWYLNALGSASRVGLTRFLRQAFIGGNYELVNRTTFKPNPDYFAALLWQQLCGQQILNANVSAPPESIKVFAACAKPGSMLTQGLPVVRGDVVLVTINFANATAEVSMSTPAPPAQQRLTWYADACAATPTYNWPRPCTAYNRPGTCSLEA